MAVSGELLLPTSGAAGFVLRLAWLALVPALLWLTRFFAPHERERARALAADAARRVAFFQGKEGEVASYVDDPLRDA